MCEVFVNLKKCSKCFSKTFLGTRGAGGQERRLVSQLMTLLDDLPSGCDVAVIGTTNRPQAIASELRRPGRFEKEVSSLFYFNAICIHFSSLPIYMYRYHYHLLATVV